MSDQSTETAAENDGFEWAIVEIMGHRRHAGRTREEERFGAKMLRVDVPKVEHVNAEGEEKPTPTITGWVTHYYGGSALFSFTPTDEATVIRTNAPYAPPSRYSLPTPERDWAAFEEVAAEFNDDEKPF